ncbi:hypothetical protein FA13DRAFT_1714361 [Coprinellus micaceus]|uniref:Uncharacterized protein n=1 Tax=Coprinellus micaceus TaxID=71717 RepID=A0A4Y7STH8_COPMI|nr:hypothetical protein FA13DRAFT_1714361 [Coprinellus micaceus]
MASGIVGRRLLIRDGFVRVDEADAISMVAGPFASDWLPHVLLRTFDLASTLEFGFIQRVIIERMVNCTVCVSVNGRRFDDLVPHLSMPVLVYGCADMETTLPSLPVTTESMRENRHGVAGSVIHAGIRCGGFAFLGRVCICGLLGEGQRRKETKFRVADGTWILGCFDTSRQIVGWERQTLGKNDFRRPCGESEKLQLVNVYDGFLS